MPPCCRNVSHKIEFSCLLLLACDAVVDLLRLLLTMLVNVACAWILEEVVHICGVTEIVVLRQRRVKMSEILEKPVSINLILGMLTTFWFALLGRGGGLSRLRMFGFVVCLGGLV